MKSVGLELNDVGVLASVHDGDEVRNIDLNESPLSQGWPGFVFKGPESLVFGQPAQDRCMEFPRQVCSSFLEELSHSSSNLGGSRKAPAHSELAYYFLRDVFTRIIKKVGEVERVAIAIPPSYLERAYDRDEKIGLLLGMVGDLGVPLVSLSDMALTSLYRSLNPLPPAGIPVIHIELFLHSAQFSFLSLNGEWRRNSLRRVQSLGLVQMMRVLTNAMADRLLRQTAFDVSEDRRIEQSFYQKLTEILASDDRSREAVLEIRGKNRDRQLKITRETLRADISPFVESMALSLSKVAHDAGVRADRCMIVLSERAWRVRGLEARLRGMGYTTIQRQTEGDAARGAAWLAREREVPADLSMVSVEEVLPLVKVEGVYSSREVVPVLVKGESTEVEPTHLVIDGVAHSLNRQQISIGVKREGEAVDLELPGGHVYSEVRAFQLIREDTGLFLEISSNTGAAAGSRELVSCGDRIVFSDEDDGGFLLFVRLAEEESWEGNG